MAESSPVRRDLATQRDRRAYPAILTRLVETYRGRSTDGGPAFPWVTIGLLVLAGALLRAKQLTFGPYEPHGFRQAQTLWPVRDYINNGIDLLRTYLPVFGEQTNIPFELPLYQALASVVARVLDTAADPAGRLVGLASFEVSCIAFAWLLNRWAGKRAAITFAGLYQVLPFGLLWGTAPLIDFFSVALGLLSVAALDSFLRRPRVTSLVVAAVLSWLTLLVKVTTFPAIGILMFATAHLALRAVPRQQILRRFGMFLAIGPGLGVGLLLLWTEHADAVKAAHTTTAWLTSEALHDWNFGTGTQRADLASYQLILGRLAQEMSGPGILGIAIAILVAFMVRQQRALISWLIVAGIASPLIFLNLYVVHSYYLIAVFPIVTALCAIAIDLVSGHVRDRHLASVTAVLLSVGLVLLCVLTPGGRSDAERIMVEGPPNTLAAQILAVSKPRDRVVTVHCDWDPSALYQSNRRGLMVTVRDPSVDWPRLRAQGYRYLAACDANPAATVPPELRLTPTDQPNVWAIVGWRGR